MQTLSILLLLMIALNKSFAQDTLMNDSWSVLQSDIGNAQVVSLGEDGHGYETYNQAKIKLFTFLFNRSGYRKLIFESSFSQCILGYLKNGSLEQRLQYFIYPFWNTGSVRNGLQKLYDQEKRMGEPFILGCDIQEDCRYVSLSGYLLQMGYVKEKKDQLLASDSLLAFYIGKKFSRQYPSANEYGLLLTNYNEVLSEIENNEQLSGLKRKLLVRCLENRKWLCYYLTIKGTQKKMYYRDSTMAENVNWLRKELPGSNKFVLWTTNLHAATLQPGFQKPQWLGEWLGRSMAKGYYAIAFKKKKMLAPDLHRLGEGLFLTFHSDDPAFHATVYCNKIVKIKSDEWITRCE